MHREERLRKERLKDITSGVLRVVDKETDTRNRRPRTRQFEDDGYSRLDGNEFLACRTQVQLRRMQEDVQPAGYKLAFLKVCALIASTVSVALGSFDLDLFIAASTALVSFFTTAQENGGYKQEVQYTHVGIKKLKIAEQEWKCLTFAAKRDPRNRDKLVRQTEDAVMELYVSLSLCLSVSLSPVL
jgi:hypothetical protein